MCLSLQFGCLSSSYILQCSLLGASEHCCEELGVLTQHSNLKMSQQMLKQVGKKINFGLKYLFLIIISSSVN